MRPFTARLWRHLRSKKVGFALMIEMDHPQGQVNVWSGTGRLFYDGVGVANPAQPRKIWEGVGHIAGVSGLESTSELLVSEIRMVLANVPSENLFSVNTNVKGREASIWWAGIGEDQRVIAEPILLNVVKLDYMTARQTDDGEGFVEAIGQNGFWILQRAADTSLTPEEQAKDFTADTGFDFVNELVNKEVTWTPAAP